MAKTIEQLLASIKKDSPTPRANFQNIVELLQAVNGKVFSESEIEGIAKDVIEGAESAGGQVDDALGLDAGGHFVKFPATIANPTLAGNESALTGIIIQGTKYKVAGGTKLYKHQIVLDSYPSYTGIHFNTTDGTISATSGSYSYASKSLTLISDSSSPMQGNGSAPNFAIGITCSFGTNGYKILNASFTQVTPANYTLTIKYIGVDNFDIYSTTITLSLECTDTITEL